MNYNEETLYLLEELGKYGMGQYDVERELSYSPNYIGQLLSRKNSNEKVVKALSLVLRIKVLESRLGVEQETTAITKGSELKEVVNILKEINANLNQTNASLNEAKHTELLNQCLLKTSILQSAKVEASITKVHPDKIIAELEKAAVKSFDDIHCSSILGGQKSKRYPVDA